MPAEAIATADPSTPGLRSQPVVRLPLGRLLVVMAGVYAVQSTVGAMMFQGVPAIMREQGLALDMIGLVSLFMLPWTVKFLWSPVLERWRLPVQERHRSRLIIGTGQAFMILVMVGLAWLPPADSFGWLIAGFGLIAVIAATVDIAGDGFLIDHLRPEHRGWGNVIQVGGGYSGIMLGSGLFLVVAGTQGWQIAMFALVGICFLLTLPCLLTADPQRGGGSGSGSRPRPSLAAAFRRPEIRWGLVVVLLSQLGLRFSMGMTGPFMIDNGITPAELGFLTGTFATALCLIAIGGIGFVIRKLGANTVLFGVLALQVLVYAGFAVAAFLPPTTLVLSGLYLAKSVIVAISFVALYTVAMAWALPRQAGVDFSIFQCADSAISVVAGLGAGVVAQHLGYQTCFGLATAATLAGLAALPFILSRINRGLAHDQ